MSVKNLHLVVAMSRSGHHAIIEWLYEQFDPEKFFFNYCDFSKPEAVFENRIQYHYNSGKYYSKISHSWVDHGELEQKLREFSPENEGVKEKIFSSDKNLVMMNFENLNPKNLPMTPSFFASHFNPKKAQTILIIRDFKNLLASKIRSGRELGLANLEKNDAVLKSTMDVWKSHAREFLSITNNLPGKVCISYDRWFADQGYRREILNELCADKEILIWNQLATYGGGSSFDRMEFKQSASRMNVLGRWAEFKDNPFFSAVCSDPEIVDLSERILYLGNQEPPSSAIF